MAKVSLLRHFTKSIVTLGGKDLGIDELGDLPLSILVSGKVRNLEKLELRKYTFTVSDEEGTLSPQNLFTLVCIPEIPDGEPFLNEAHGEKTSDLPGVDWAHTKLRALNYEVVEEIFLSQKI